MNKRKTILPTVIEYFISSSSHLVLRSSAEKLNNKITEVLIEMNNLMESKILPKENCQEIADKIDELLVIAADFSSRKIGGEEIEVLKERIWFLLESLEYHCVKNHNMSIW